MIVWPSARRRRVRRSMPWGYLGFSSPLVLSVRRVGGDAFGTGLLGFVGGVSGDPGEDSGRDRASDRRPVRHRERLSQLVDRRQLARRHLFHQGIDLARRRHDDGAGSPAPTHRTGDRHDLRQALVVGEFLAPGLPLHSYPPNRSQGGAARISFKTARAKGTVPFFFADSEKLGQSAAVFETASSYFDSATPFDPPGIEFP